MTACRPTFPQQSSLLSHSFPADLDHMKISFKQLDSVTVLEQNCPPASPVSQCAEAALADFFIYYSSLCHC